MLTLSAFGLILGAVLGQQTIESRPLEPVTVQEAAPAEEDAPAPVDRVLEEWEWQNVPKEAPGEAPPPVEVLPPAPVVEAVETPQENAQAEPEAAEPPVEAPVPAETVKERAPEPAPQPVPSGRPVAAFWMIVPGL